jgi:hypothetical protein
MQNLARDQEWSGRCRMRLAGQFIRARVGPAGRDKISLDNRTLKPTLQTPLSETPDERTERS